MLKRLAIAGMAALILWTAPVSALAKAPPAMHGRAAALIDATTGQVLFQQNGADTNFPASTTKLLTALVAVEHGKLDQVIKVSARAVNQAPDSSSCYLNQGEEQTLENLLFGLLLVSGNDCAVAIAEGLTNGHSEQFVTWMNETARRLGATKSKFSNPHGLHESTHYTTALDLALIARGALSNPTVLKIAGTREFNWPGKNNGTYYNHNAMLFTYDDTVGGKTGFTEEANLTLVNAAKRNGLFLVGVVMGEESKVNQYNDMAQLLNYGFETFEPKSVVAQESTWGTVKVQSGKAESVPAIAREKAVVTGVRGAEAPVSVIANLTPSLKAPVTAGQKVGTLEVRDGDRVIKSIDLVAAADVAQWLPSGKTVLSWVLTAIKWLIYLLLGLLAFRTVVKAIRRARKKRRRRPARGQRFAGSQGSHSASIYHSRDL